MKLIRNNESPNQKTEKYDINLFYTIVKLMVISFFKIHVNCG